MTNKWKGGQPPVGEECEYSTDFFSIDKNNKGVCTILCRHKGKVWIDVKGSSEYVISLSVIKFSPLKKPDEIERERVVELAENTYRKYNIGGLYGSQLRWFAGLLYDAGLLHDKKVKPLSSCLLAGYINEFDMTLKTFDALVRDGYIIGADND